MKQLLHISLLSVVLLTLFNQRLLCGTNSNSFESIIPKNLSSSPVPSVSFPSYVYKNGDADIQNVAQYKVIDSLFDAFSYYGLVQSPLVWYPRLNILATITRGAFPSNPNLNIDIAKNCSDAIKIKTSYDVGETWNKDLTVYLDISDNAQLGRPRYPSLGVFSEQQVDDKSTVKFACYAPLTKSIDSSLWNATYFGLVENNALKDPVNDNVNDFSINSKQFMLGSETQLSTLETDDNAYCIAPSSLNPANLKDVTDNERNPFGLLFVDYNNEVSNLRITPDSWSSNRFQPTSIGKRSSVLVGSDSYNKSMYVCTFGYYNTSVTKDTNKTFAVSTSTDFGRTWSEFNACPKSIIDSYALSQGIPKDSLLFDFNWKWDRNKDSSVTTSFDFVCTGDNEFSIVSEVVLNTVNKLPQIVELYFKDNQWGIRKVADITLCSRLDLLTKLITPINKETTGYTSTQKGCEVQIAKTQDLSSVVVKFLETMVYVFPKGLGRFDKDNVPIIPDTVITTDVAMVNRTKNSSTWSTPKNATNSFIFDRITWIPKILPNDLRNVPLLTVQNADQSGSKLDVNIFSQSRLSTLKQSEYEKFKHYITLSSIDFNSLPTYERVLIGVDELPRDVEFKIEPNPANENVTFTICNQNSFNGRIEVSNSLGQIVLFKDITVASDRQAVNIDVSKMLSGNYHCKFLSDFGVITKSFVVIH